MEVDDETKKKEVSFLSYLNCIHGLDLYYMYLLNLID